MSSSAQPTLLQKPRLLSEGFNGVHCLHASFFSPPEEQLRQLHSQTYGRQCIKHDLHIPLKQTPGEAANLLTLWLQGGKDTAHWYPWGYLPSKRKYTISHT